MDRFPQPPDPPEEGNCRRCDCWITRDELLIDGCTECDDLLIDDMRTLWDGRPKDEPISEILCPIYVFDLNERPKQPCDFVWLDWRYSEPNWGSVL